MVKILLITLSVTFSINLSAQTVYVTKTGEKYNKSICKYLKYSKKETTIKKAKSLGYSACKVCKPTMDNTAKIPDTSLYLVPKSDSNTNKSATKIKNVTSTRCKGKTKKGVRCKRMTKNSNGRCYQH